MNLPFTDGSNGNGIRDPDMLAKYLKECPLAFFDHRYMESYRDLLFEIGDPCKVIFDNMAPRASRDIPLSESDRREFLKAHRGALEELLRPRITPSDGCGKYYTLCPGCTEKEKGGIPAVRSCRNVAIMIPLEKRTSECCFTNDNIVLSCCGVASQVRDITIKEDFDAAIEVAKRNVA